jgi:hypothetical protein
VGLLGSMFVDGKIVLVLTHGFRPEVRGVESPSKM